MSAEEITLTQDAFLLRSIGIADQELVRGWRNLRRNAFFQRATIEASDQARWFSEYLQRSDDFLFVIDHSQRPFGCLGIRLRQDHWDIYNVLRGLEDEQTRGGMGAGLRAAISFAQTRELLPVQAIVLADNPAVSWYRRQGFEIISRTKTKGFDCVTMRWFNPHNDGIAQ